MKIKTKIRLGIGLLFLLILLLGIVGTRYINELKQDTENILTANYNTLHYSRTMLVALEDGSDQAMQLFDTNLEKQKNNISEIGEKEATLELSQYVERLKSDRNNPVLKKNIREEIFKIMEMNMKAIQEKSEIAKNTADNAIFWIVITGTLCFLIALILLLNLPSNIAKTITTFTGGIRQIAAKNYAERVHLEGDSEFGQLAISFNTMAEKLEEYNNSNLAKLMMEKKRIEALINNMQDPVLGLDENLLVIFANHEAIKISGLTESGLIGFPATELAEKNDLIRTLIQDIHQPDSGAKPKPIKIFADNKEGYFEKETLHISLPPTGEQTQRLVGHMIILRNVTEYKELDSAKTNFIATVSHEFKTPISSIRLSLQLLQNEQIGKLNEEQQNLIDSIQEDTARLLKITGELLNMTQVESGNIQLAILPADPQEILRYSVNSTKMQADQKHIKFEISCPATLPRVHADHEKTAWVLTNLISNAIRYSHDHSTIHLSITPQEDRVQISVRDTGQGIPPQYKDKIFDRYFRVPGSSKEGTGLGLAISKEFIEAQGGQISVDSEFGAGSTFTVTLNKIK
ncbi:ATP-binding protein [Algoriphagus sp. A40]|uniref:HAMP domain-containing sensor histidine kinase n=1 Tax=Algoriphagus sp. A40 TaxID=1945863 RepID=UPI000985CF10|nr:ATP-binding protein [Algoriphagus sp. A40]OOG77631.1 PAS domain-containing sensor histidine kinase [Algoriphagus sp. A40]